MEMGHHVAERGEVDLVRRGKGAQRRLDGENDVHGMTAIIGVEVGHFGNMIAPDDAAKSRERFTLGSTDPNDPAQAVLPDDFTAGG